MVVEENRLTVIPHADFIGVFLAREFRRAEAGTDLHALHGVDGHQGGGDIAVELAIDRRAEPRRHALGHDFQHRADGRAILADAIEILAKELGGLGIRAEEGVAIHLLPIPVPAVDPMRAHLHQRATHAAARHNLARNRPGGDPHRGFARRGAPAAARIADAVFRVIGEIGVARAETRGDLRIILRALIHIVDQQADRGARGALDAIGLGEHAREDADLIRLLPLRGELRLPRAAAIEIALDLLRRQRDQWRAAIHHAANGRPVAFAEGGETEEVPEGIVRHEPGFSGKPLICKTVQRTSTEKK